MALIDMVIEKNITPQNSTVKDVLSMQNIYTLNTKIIQNHLNNPDYIIDTNLIRFWHHTLMSGVIENAGEFSKKIRILPIEAGSKQWSKTSLAS